MIVYVTVREHFNAGHRLHNPDLDEEQNRSLYGKCNNPSGHGLNYILEVTLRGDVDPKIGAFVNPEEVKAWLWSEVLDRVDHYNLNTDVDFMKGVIPTSENLVRNLFVQLKTGRFGHWLHEATIYESANNSASYRED